MTLAIRSILRKSTKKDTDRIQILCSPTHERYQQGWSTLNADFWMYQAQGIKTWNPKFGIMPNNHHNIRPLHPEENILNPLPKFIDFDCVLSQSKAGQYQVLKQLSDIMRLPLINLEHTLPTPDWERSPQTMRQLKQMSGHINIFISEYSRKKWGWEEDEAEVIHHGINTDLFKSSDSERKSVILSVVNDWVNRNWCQLAGQQILTINGYVNIENIIVGNKVLSDNGLFNNVIEIFNRDYYGDIIEIYLDNNEKSISFTPDHHIRVFRDSQEKYVEANRLRVGDQLKFPNIQQSYFYPEDTDYAWLIGSIIGDGSISKNGTVSISYKIDDLHLANKASKLLNKYTNNKSTVSTRGKDKGIYIVELTSKIFGLWLKNKIGDYSKTKKIPEELFLGSNNTKLSILQGLWSADGSFKNGKSKSPRFVYSTTSVVLASQVSALLHHFGIKCNIKKEKRTTNKSNGKLLNIYRVIGTGKTNVNNCIDLIQNNKILKSYSYNISKIELHENINTKVYNCHVNNDPSYVIYPGFVAHNCCGFNIWRQATQGLPVLPVGDTKGLSAPAKSIEELVNFYQTSQIFINTSTISPVPTALLEAMSCGCACVSTATCMIPEIIENGVNGFLTNDPQQMRMYLQQCLNDKELCAKLGYNAQQTILKKFNQETFVNKWTEVFNRVCKD